MSTPVDQVDDVKSPWQDPQELFLSAAALGCCILGAISVIKSYARHVDQVLDKQEAARAAIAPPATSYPPGMLETDPRDGHIITPPIGASD